MGKLGQKIIPFHETLRSLMAVLRAVLDGAPVPDYNGDPWDTKLSATVSEEIIIGNIRKSRGNARLEHVLWLAHSCGMHAAYSEDQWHFDNMNAVIASQKLVIAKLQDRIKELEKQIS